MKKILSLIKVLFKLNINNSDTKTANKKIIIWVLFGWYILFVFYNYWKTFINPLQILGEGDKAIYLVLSISSTFILMTGLTYIISVLYFTNDMENIIPFPFKPREIFVAKLAVVYLYELMIGLILSLPGFIAFGVELSKDISYYLIAFVVFLFIPIMPITLLTIINTVIMNFLKLNNHQSFFKILTTILLLIVILFFQMQLNNNMLPNGDYDGKYVLELCNGFKQHLPFYLNSAADALIQRDIFVSLLALTVYISENVLVSILTVFCFDKLYLKGIYNNSKYLEKRKNNSKIDWKIKNKFRSVVTVELKKLFRNVTYFIQCVLPTTFMPAIIIISIISGANVQAEINIASNPIIKMMFSILIVQFFMMMNQISATAISRDGKEEAGFYKSIPVTKYKLILAKAMPSIYVGLFNMSISIIFNYFIFKLSIIEIIELVLIGIALNIFQSYLFIILDLKNPKLKWESEIAVVKHNMNVLKSILIWFGIIILTALVGNVFLMANIKYFAPAFLIVVLLINLWLVNYLKRNTDRLYEKIF